MELPKRLREVRRMLHGLAETGFELTKTRGALNQLLGEAGLAPRDVAGGMVAETGEGKNCVLLRADMDALPVLDGKDVAYASVNQGACHACGHDAHMAMLYGAALQLKEETLPGRVRLMYQPAEECPPGGALGMVEAGVLDGVGMAFALHVAPWLPFGMVGIKEGPVMAATDNFTLTVLGRGGHGAMPHQCADAVLAAAHVVTGLQALVSRMTDPLEPLVVTVGKVSGGTANNVIADCVVLEGTVRTLNRELRDNMPELLEKTAGHICRGFGADCKLKYDFGYPVLCNGEAGVRLALEAAAAVVGEERVMRVEKPLMGGEDFAFILEQVPGAYLFLGTGDEEHSYPLHHPCFDLNEEILPVGAAVFAELAKSALVRMK